MSIPIEYLLTVEGGTCLHMNTKSVLAESREVDWDRLAQSLVKSRLIETSLGIELVGLLLELSVVGPLPVQCREHPLQVCFRYHL